MEHGRCRVRAAGERRLSNRAELSLAAQTGILHVMDTPEPMPMQGPPRRQSPLWIIAGLVLAGAILAMFLVPIAPVRDTQVETQIERFRQLGAALERYAKNHEGVFPDDPADTGLQDPRTLLTDAATGQPITYQLVTASGERIGYDFLGDRIIAWSPQTSYRDARALLLNSGDVRFAPDAMIDMADQRLMGMEKPDMMRPRLEMGGDDTDGADEDDEEDEMTADMPATQPGD
jgi:hypothetical protein